MGHTGCAYAFSCDHTFMHLPFTYAGVPKGVVLTHSALISAIASQVAFMQDPWGWTGMARQQQQQQQQAAAEPMSGGVSGGDGGATAAGPPAAGAADSQQAKKKRAYPSYLPK